MAEDNNNLNTQRPIGIKPITIKPMQPPAQASVPFAPAPGAKNSSAGSAENASGIRPINISPNTSAGKPLESVAATTTIRLKPVMPSKAMHADARPDAGVTAPLKPLRPQTIQPTSIRPSIMPIPDGAAKSKTSRISLDSAMGEGSSSPNLHIGGISPAPVGKITSNLTADALGAAKGQTSRVSLPLVASDSEATRRRTLRVKAPSAAAEDQQEPAAESLTEAPTVRKKKSLILKKDKLDAATSGTSLNSGEGEEGSDPVSAFSAFQSVPVKKTNPIFPVLAVAAIFMIIAMLVMYMSQACGPDRSLTAFSSFPDMSFSPGWPGKILSF